MLVRGPRFAHVLFAALIATAGGTGVASATTWLVPGDGSNTCTIGSPNCDTVAQAVAASAANDTISIGAGSFSVPVTLSLPHQLTIVGSGTASTTLAVSAGVVAFDVQANGIVIQDLKVQGGIHGVRFPVTSDDTDLTRVHFDAQTSRGVEISPPSGSPVTNVTVTDSTFSAIPIGLRMASTSTVTGLTITGTTFSGNGYGVYQANDNGTSSLTGFTVDGCTFTDNTNYGIYAEEMRTALIRGSTFTGGGTAIGVIKFYSSNGLPLSGIGIRGNQFSGFAGNAIDLENIARGLGSPLSIEVEIEENTITKDVSIQTVPAAVFVRLHPVQSNGLVNFTRNAISLTGTFGSAVVAHAVQLRGNGPVSFVGNTLYGGNVGGSGTTPPTSGIFIQSRSGSTIMPASTAIYGSDNCIRNFHNGVSVFDSFANAYGGLHGSAYVAFVDDDITGNDTAGVANGASPTLDFSDNWWGCAGGPGNPGCDATIGAVDSNPALAAPTVCFVCSVDAHCDDGLFCTGVETCNAGFCQASGDPCTGGAACNDVCDEVADGCVAPDGSSCDDGDACTIDDVCTAGACGGGPSCGDGVEQPGCGEACDDGNTTSNDGCSATCQDEFVCTPAPLAGCRTSEATKSQLQIKDREDLKDQVKWKWTRGAVTPKLDYGTPLTTTDYRLCIYANGALVSRTHIPAGGVCLTKPCWKETKAGYVYKDKEATPDGITGLTLKEGLVPGKAKISLKGKGVNVDTPDLPLALPVTVQLRAANGVCWESVHSAPAQKNDELLYKDKSD